MLNRKQSMSFNSTLVESLATHKAEIRSKIGANRTTIEIKHKNLIEDVPRPKWRIDTFEMNGKKILNYNILFILLL